MRTKIPAFLVGVWLFPQPEWQENRVNPSNKQSVKRLAFS